MVMHSKTHSLRKNKPKPNRRKITSKWVPVPLVVDDGLDKVLPGRDTISRAMRWMVRIRLVSREHPRTADYFKSMAAVKKERRRHLSGYSGMIHPFSDFRYTWETMMAIAGYILAFILPYQWAMMISQPNISSSKGTSTCIFVLNIIFLVDVIINLNTGHLNKNKTRVILNRKSVLTKYLQTYFTIDFVSVMPLYVYGMYSEEFWKEMSYLEKYILVGNVIGFIRCIRWRSYHKYTYRFLFKTGFAFQYQKLVRRIIDSCTVSHFFICLYIAVARFERGDAGQCSPDKCWTEAELETYNNYPFRMYVTYVHRCVDRLAKVAPTGKQLADMTRGDIIMTVILYNVGTFISIFICCQTFVVLLNLAAVNLKYDEQFQQMQEFMKRKLLPSDIRDKITKYIQFRYQLTSFDEKRISDMLSKKLKKEIILHATQHFIEYVPLFRDIPKGALIAIAKELRSMTFMPGDVILKAGEIGDEMYLIVAGTVAVFTHDGQEIAHLEDGNHFGEIALIRTDYTRIATVVAVSACDLYILHRKNFLRAIAPYPDLLDRMKKRAAYRMQKTRDVEESMNSTSTSDDESSISSS